MSDKYKRLVTISSKGNPDNDIYIKNIKTYHDLEDKSYLFTFGMGDDNEIYFSLEYHEYKNDDTFHNIKDVKDPLALGKNLRLIFDKALSNYIGDIRDNKIKKLLSIN
jgi:hypothetical protein